MAESQDPGKPQKIGAPLPGRSARLAPGKRASALYVSGAVSGNRVILVGERGVILLSRDGGISYDQIEVPTRRLLSEVILRDDGVAIAVGHESTVLRSVDSGETWQRVHHDPDQDLALFSVTDAGKGLIVAVGAFGLVLRSSDDGLTWQQGLISEDGPHLYSVKSSVDGLVTVGEFGSLYSSKDQGLNWNLLPTPYEGTLFDILVVEDRWILMGLRGNLWEGSGSRWQKVSHDSEATLFGGARLSDGTIVVVGAEGVTLMRSPQSGDWRSLAVKEDDRRLLSIPLPLADDSVLGLGEKGYRLLLGPGGDPLGEGDSR